MNILYITISDLSDLNKRGIYPDLIRKFIEKGHYVTIITPTERKYKKSTNLKKGEGYQILQLKTGNLFKTNLIEKGITNLLLEWQYKKAIQKYFSNIKFDLVLYASPPVTFAKVIDFVKRRDHAKSYLMLKDIFPQNALDIGLLTKTGLKGILYRMFKRKEKAFYGASDFIGCMSPANVRYLLQHNPEIAPERVEVCPNSIKPVARVVSPKEKICQKYSIPREKVLFIYGGNFGKPQGVDFVVESLKQNINKEDRHFILCGKGTDFYKVKELEGADNITLINGLPKSEYDELVCGCDVGLIFLDHRFTIPNFPSRLLSYMENGMPVLAVTDPNSDVGQIATKGGFGWWCESNDALSFTKTVDLICSQKDQIKSMGQRARAYLEENYTVDTEYEIIAKHFIKKHMKKQKGEFGIFFRVLEPRLACSGKEICRSTYQDWLDKKYTSSHDWIPQHWKIKWETTHSTDPEDYLLESEDAVRNNNGYNNVEYTVAARNCFINYLIQHGDRVDLSEVPYEIRVRCGEYNGVSAYDNLDDALSYAQGGVSCAIAVFRGRVNGFLPEKNGYAVLVEESIAILNLVKEISGRKVLKEAEKLESLKTIYGTSLIINGN